jgi:hypothetical protein
VNGANSEVIAAASQKTNLLLNSTLVTEIFKEGVLGLASKAWGYHIPKIKVRLVFKN